VQINVQGVDQLIDGARGVLFGDLAEMGVTRGGGRTRMAEQGLDMA